MHISNWINSQEQSSDQNFQKNNPFTQENLYSVSQSTPLDIVKSIQSSHAAFSNWKDSSLADRLQFLNQILVSYQNLKSELIQLEALDQGLSSEFTEKANYDVGLKFLENYKIELQAQVNQPDSSKIYSPVGVTVCLLSWNLSQRLFIEKVLPAVLAGNAVIVKLSSLTASTSLIWRKILTKSDMPAGLIQFIHSADHKISELLVLHPTVKAVIMTGTLEHVQDLYAKIAKLSHRQAKKIQMHSGTKNPAIVLDGPSLELVDQVLESFLAGQGQLAWNSSRLFVLEKQAALWKEALQENLSKIRPLLDISEKGYWGPLLRLDSQERYSEHFNLAKADHAHLIQANELLVKDLKGIYLNPIWTTDMSKCSTLQQDQLLTPVFILSEVKYPFDIPKNSNVSYYGHSASLWSKDKSPEKIIQNLEVGLISMNRWSIYQPKSISGVKQSTFGIADHRIFGSFYSDVKILV